MKLFLKQISLLFRNFLYHYNPHWSHEATILLNSLITDACPFLRGFVRSTRIIVSINVNIRRRLDTKSWWHFGKYPKKILHILLDIFYISNLISNIIYICLIKNYDSVLIYINIIKIMCVADFHIIMEILYLLLGTKGFWKLYREYETIPTLFEKIHQQKQYYCANFMRNIHRENIVKASLEKSTNTEGQTMSPLAAPHFHYHSAIDRFSPLGRPNPLPYIADCQPGNIYNLRQQQCIHTLTLHWLHSSPNTKWKSRTERREVRGLCVLKEY